MEESRWYQYRAYQRLYEVKGFDRETESKRIKGSEERPPRAGR